MHTREYFEWWLDACTVRYLSPQDTLDDPQLDDLPVGIPLRASQQEGQVERLVGVIDSEEEEEIARQNNSAGPSRVGGQAEQEQPGPDIGGDGVAQAEPVIGDAEPAHDATLDDDFFSGAKHDFAASFGASEYAPSAHVDPSIRFIATMPGSQADDIAARFRRARGARDTQQVSVMLDFVNPRSRQVYRIVSSNTTVKWVSIPRGLKD
ncbi:hypothetical protein PIB30_072484 [Stylosanthes scabra]|uniref:Uncharacterized protein n=1 Tax=Stylosanthes scabra TaxID=79078 RepID=A0ABU6TQM3_9FABA|nr:hypothetical protein [Stylosanthes scabra]